MAERHASRRGTLSSRRGLRPACEPAASLPAIFYFAAESAKPGGDDGLYGLLDSFLKHYVRLGGLKGALRMCLPGRRRGNGCSAIRQIELERERLGRELHTGLGQVLAALRLQLELVAGTLTDPRPAAQQALDRMAMLVQDGLDQVRALSHALYPPDWQRFSLERAIRQLWELSGIPEKYEAVLDIQLLAADPPLDVKILIYRSAQEALSNIIRHSNAHRVEMQLKSDGSQIVLRVHDDGAGFNAHDVLSGHATSSSGVGLRCIRDQAQALDGTFHLESGRSGTKLEILSPLPYNSEIRRRS